MKSFSNLLFAAIITLFLANQLSAQIVVIKKPVTPKTVVIKTKQPGKTHVWIDGHWIVKNNRYVWKKGYWAKPKPHHRWKSGRWIKVRGGWKWTPGHWIKIRA